MLFKHFHLKLGMGLIGQGLNPEMYFYDASIISHDNPKKMFLQSSIVHPKT
jgi:hypothetical protein